MSDQDPASLPNRPALPRDAFRSQRAVASPGPAAVKPVVVTPDYGDAPVVPRASTPAQPKPDSTESRREPKRRRADHNPFDAYGERSSSRPYALRLPDQIDLVVRQLAAEQHTHPLRIIDRILHDHLKRIGRLPPPPGD
ncbi:hypothetical protein ACU4GH_40340 (plasmid) [Bradyrhizobium betae]